MKKSTILVLFAALCLLQLAVPSSMIYKRETTLRQGEVFKFKTAPVDPYDAFRGRYVALNYEQGTIRGDWSPEEYRRNRTVYALLERDAEGYAQIVGVRLVRPEDAMFLKVRVGWVSGDSMTLRLPFDRYYMDEFEAPVAEREFAWQRNREERAAYARARVLKGFGVIEELIVEETPIRQWIQSRTLPQP